MSAGRERIQSIQAAPIEEEVVTDENPTETESPGSESDTEAQDTGPESAEDSVRKALAELEGGKTEAEEPSSADNLEAAPEKEEKPAKLGKLPTESEEEESPKQVRPAKEPEVDTDALDPELHPPERLQAKEKLLFNNLPKGLKRGLHRVIKDMEAGSTKVVQETKREAEEIRSIRDAVQPFAGEWAERGFSVPQGIMSLARAQQKLVDPKTRIPTFIALAKDLGIAPEHIAQHLSGQNGTAAPDVTAHPEFNALRERQQQLESRLEQQNLSASVQPIVQEMNAARHEVDPASGKFRYPELHDESYLESLKTRVTEIIGNEPGIGAGAALLKANAERKQALFGYSSSVSQQNTRIPASANQNTRAQAAAVSVRGRTASRVTNGGDQQPPPEALKNPAATTKWVLENLRRGNLT